MNNKLRQRRYLARLLLVQLASGDEGFTLKVQRKLTEAIHISLTMLDNGNIDLMKDMGNQITHEQLDRALFNLLMQLSFIPDQLSKQILHNSDYRVPDVTDFEAEFSRLVDADCYVSCISLPSDST